MCHSGRLWKPPWFPLLRQNDQMCAFCVYGMREIHDDARQVIWYSCGWPAWFTVVWSCAGTASMAVNIGHATGGANLRPMPWPSFNTVQGCVSVSSILRGYLQLGPLLGTNVRCLWLIMHLQFWLSTTQKQILPGCGPIKQSHVSLFQWWLWQWYFLPGNQQNCGPTSSLHYWI